MELAVLFGTFVILLVMGVPVAFCLGLSAVAGVSAMGSVLIDVTYLIAAKRGYPSGVFPGWRQLGVALILAAPGLLSAIIIVGGIPIERSVRSIWPFYAAMIGVLLLITAFPSISLSLPGLLD